MYVFRGKNEVGLWGCLAVVLAHVEVTEICGLNEFVSRWYVVE